MGHNEAAKKKTIREAVNEGTLVDVSDIGKSVGMKYRTFMSPSLVAKYESQCPGGGVIANLHFYSFVLDNCDYEMVGPVGSGETVCILEPNDEYGHVILILEEGRAEELRLTRSTGSAPEYLM